MPSLLPLTDTVSRMGGCDQGGGLVAHHVWFPQAQIDTDNVLLEALFSANAAAAAEALAKVKALPVDGIYIHTPRLQHH